MKIETFGYLVFMTFIMVSTTMAAPTRGLQSQDKQVYTLHYLEHVTHGKTLHKIPVKASSFHEAIVVSRKQCVQDLMDLNLNNQDILDLCNNPREL